MLSEARREADRILAASQFLTRLPIRPSAYDPDWLPRSARYFPLVGIVVGALAGTVLVGAAQLWPAPIPAIMALGAALLLTGALHEDGLADCADSLGGRTRETRLAIMKDPRLGAFGGLALLVSLALQAAALAGLDPWRAAAALVAAHAASRLAPVLVMALQSYAGERSASRIAHAEDRPRPGEIALAAAFAAAPILLLPPAQGAAGLLLGAAAAAFASWRLCRTLGGYTGDVLGASVVIFQTGFLLGAAVDLGALVP